MKWSIGDGPVALIAHRGDAAASRENTLPAIVDAVRAGADAVEVDVKITADGEVILLHDADLRRLWGGDERQVSDLDFPEIRELTEATGGWHQIPTLTSALALTGGTGTDLLIDLDAPDWAAPAQRVVADAVAEKLIRASEVSWCGRGEAMSIIRATDPDARIVLSWDEASDEGRLPGEELLTELSPEAFNPHWPMLTPTVVDWTRAHDLALCCWTVDDAGQAEQVLDLGVDAIITNDLRTLRAMTRNTSTAGPSMSAEHGSVDLDLALSVALACAERAMAITRDSPLGDLRTKKHDADIVTDVDTAVERAVRRLIAETFPDHRVVGEEYGGEAGAGPAWYCDPVDGTTNLAAGLPWTSFSLSLAIGRQPLVGVVADPWRGEVMQAMAGGGALIDGSAVELTPSRDRLRGGVVLTEWASYRPWPGMLALMDGLAAQHCTPRVMGSGTLTLAHVAAGRASGAVIGEFHPEDHLAAALIAREAGLAVWNEDGAADPFPTSGGILVARPAVAEELDALWRAAREQAARQP